MKKNKSRKNSRKGITIVNKINHSGERSTKKMIVSRSYTAALLLSIFLGWLGVDRFYVNHIGLGILKLITLGAGGIWWIIGIIMFATKNVSYVNFK